MIGNPPFNVGAFQDTVAERLAPATTVGAASVLGIEFPVVTVQNTALFAVGVAGSPSRGLHNAKV